MTPQHQDHHGLTMNQLDHQQEEDLDDGERLTVDEPPSSSQSSAEDLFRYIDQQHSNVKSQLDACEAKRKEIVREMAQHMLTLESGDDDDDDDDGDDSVCQRHTELTVKLSGIKREQKKLKRKFASIKVLSDKRNDVETLMRRRLKATSNGDPNNFGVEELHQIIESQAFATLEVEILNQERSLLEVQLIESKKHTERLKLQCSEKDERIKLLKEQNESYQHEIARLRSESPVSSQVSQAEMTQISSLRYNLLAENQYIRKRLIIRTSHSEPQVCTSSKPMITPPSTVQISDFKASQDEVPQTSNQKKANDENKELAIDTKGNLEGDKRQSDENIKRKEEEEKLRQKQRILHDEEAKEKEKFLREQYLKQEIREQEERERVEQHHQRQEQKREEWARDEAAKEEEKRIRQLQEQLQASRQAEEDIEEKRKQQQQKREQHAGDQNTKEEERQIRELQAQLVLARQASDEAVANPSDYAAGRMTSIPETSENEETRSSLEITNCELQTRRQADRMASISPTQSTKGAMASRSVRSLSPTPSTRGAMTSMPMPPTRAQSLALSLSPTPSTEGAMANMSTPPTHAQSFGLSRSLLDTKSLSPTPSRSVRSPLRPLGLSQSLRDTKSLDANSKDVAKSAFGSMPGAMRMSAITSLLESGEDSSASDDSVDEVEIDQSKYNYTVTATLVEEDDAFHNSQTSIDVSERERLFAKRERELEAREAEIVKQVRSIRINAVPAVAIATISKRGSYRKVDNLAVSESTLVGRSGRTQGGEGVLGELDPGPLRFESIERSLKAQFNDMSDNDYYCFSQIQERWEKKRKDKGGAAYSEALILRFLRNTCKKDGSFNVPKAWKAMKKTNERNLFLSAGKLQKQLLTATLFPVPGLLSNAGLEMFYMKPCRFHRKDSVRDVIDNLVYVMNCMLEREGNAKNGIGFLACMNDWKMCNFEVNYCYKFMMALQSMVVPVAVELFLIVNPPSWFGNIWKIMKPMLAPSFRKKVKVIKEAMLDNYLMEGYQEFLPDDLATGTVDTFQLAGDFVTYRKHVEFGNVLLNAKSAYSADDDNSSSRSGDNSRRKTFRTLDDTSFRSSSDQSEGFLGSAYGSSSQEVENDDDDASIHCSIDGSVENEYSMDEV